jgi:hypothetical protein
VRFSLAGAPGSLLRPGRSFQIGQPGQGRLAIEGAMQQAPQPGRQSTVATGAGVSSSTMAAW